MDELMVYGRISCLADKKRVNGQSEQHTLKSTLCSADLKSGEHDRESILWMIIMKQLSLNTTYTWGASQSLVKKSPSEGNPSSHEKTETVNMYASIEIRYLFKNSKKKQARLRSLQTFRQGKVRKRRERCNPHNYISRHKIQRIFKT